MSGEKLTAVNFGLKAPLTLELTAVNSGFGRPYFAPLQPSDIRTDFGSGGDRELKR
ncbi:hypothetical protein [Neoaquamicrobium microcysteis]|uniref:hypothetical protein n=1 Tax=Neoaquamicrobium microcysteis TaxID=2682781 RepID=UPI001375BAA2|nr:hypothetical protein [Mesorhizobium microcysteis]